MAKSRRFTVATVTIPEPLAYGDHRRIRAAKPEIGVPAHEDRHPPKVRIDKLHQLEGCSQAPMPTLSKKAASAIGPSVLSMR